MKNKQYEAMRKFTVNDLTVRLWITVDDPKKTYDPDTIATVVENALAKDGTNDPAKALGIIESVNDHFQGEIAAAEALDRDGCGCLIYPDWK